MSSRELKNAGLKVTSSRMKILEVFAEEAKSHLSADEIYRALVKRGETVGIATVYRALPQFESAGLLTRRCFDGIHSVYELASTEHHDHLLCVRCQRVVEFTDPVIEARQNAIARQHGFDITDHSLYLYGICPDCRNRLAAES